MWVDIGVYPNVEERGNTWNYGVWFGDRMFNYYAKQFYSQIIKYDTDQKKIMRQTATYAHFSSPYSPEQSENELCETFLNGVKTLSARLCAQHLFRGEPCTYCVLFSSRRCLRHFIFYQIERNRLSANVAKIIPFYTDLKKKLQGDKTPVTKWQINGMDYSFWSSK